MNEINQLGFPILSVLVFLPIVAAVVIGLLGRDSAGMIRGIAIVTATIELVLGIWVLASFQPIVGFQHVERATWIPTVGLEYHLGVDGVSVLMVFLTTFLTLIALVASSERIETNPKPWAGFLLLLEAGILGAFVALDAILFFVFWEAMLIPMYLLIGTLGGPRRIYAAVKFFIYTAVGSLIMLLGIIWLHYLAAQGGAPTFDIVRLVQTRVPPETQTILFLMFALAFAIKVPVFPLHTWLPDTYTQTPLTALVLGTMLVKVGAYGFIRFCLPLFPEAMLAWAPVFATLAVIGILYGAMLAIAQRDLVRLLAYSSISHLGFIVLGIFAFNIQGLSGATIQMVNHGISTGGLFLVASMLLARTLTTDIESMGGLAKRWPVLTGFFTIIMFSSLGLPGLNGFVGEFLILVGAYQRWTGWAIAAAFGVVLAAIYFLWMFQRSMHGPLRASVGVGAPDLTTREVLILTPIVILIVWIGLYPSSFLGPVQPSLTALLQTSRIAQTDGAPAPPLAFTGALATTTAATSPEVAGK